MTHTLFATHSGKLIDFKNMFMKDISLNDIAHHLCNINRFGGCLPLGTMYSVASHSLNCLAVAKITYKGDVEFYKAVLMHDATEAYLGDVVSGLKTCLLDYQTIENKLENLLKFKYSINFKKYKKTIKIIDKRMMITEVEHLNNKNKHLYNTDDKWQPYKFTNWRIKPDKYPECIKQLFLDSCKEFGIHD